MEWLKAVIDYGVIGLLIAMSVVALAIAFERRRFYAGVQISSFKSKKELEIELTRRLHLIATIGSNAPYIGLLGTVLGIMLTFSEMGNGGLMEPGRIMSGLALALKATAIGLLVAIPSVTLYNLLLRRVKELVYRWEAAHGREGL